MDCKVAKVAVSAATYWIDKPYDYLIPGELAEKAVQGVRVVVPFSSGNRRSEGIILSITDSSQYEKLKTITAVLDEKPLLTPQQINLALFMRERFFCTVYEAVRAILPAGLWFDADGKRRVSDSTVEFVRLIMSADEAVEAAETFRKKAPARYRMLKELISYGEMEAGDLILFSGTSRKTMNTLAAEGFAEIIRREVLRVPDFTGSLKALPRLNDEQQYAFDGISRQADSGSYSAALLHGITGSGKTAVYIRLIDHELKKGKTAILLVPEIALTPQMLHTFSSHFGDSIAVLHSSLTSRERLDEWKRLKAGKAKVAIGTRSAIFAPVEDLGLVIIDEEQEDSYRSESNPRYHAHEIAKYRCYKSNALLVFGSATPNICTRYFAEKGNYSYFRLSKRFNEMHLPEVAVVDMKNELRSGRDGSISLFLRDEIQKNIDNGEQSILFLNRRGARKLVTCGVCGYIYKCPHCSVSLTYHSVNNRLVCHYCGFAQQLDECCPDCGGVLKFIGAGTQLVEEELHTLFPDIEVIRIDTDVLNAGNTHEKIFEKFINEKIPVMIGTQMVTKGLNFENVTLVGVISADQSLYTGDYRAAEKTFSLITQVIGRSGRGSKPGRAVIQTFTPQNEVILQSAAQDYDSFYQTEIAIRSLQDAPPYSDILALSVSGSDERKVIEGCRFVKARLTTTLKDENNLEVLGPTPMSVVKVNNRFRYRVILKCALNKRIRSVVSAIIVECSTDKRFRNMSFYAENDPES